MLFFAKALSPPAKQASAFAKAIAALTRDALDMGELSDRYAAAVSELAEGKQKKGKDVVKTSGAESDDAGPASADVIDLMKVLRQRLAKDATVTIAGDVATRRKGSSDNVHALPKRAARAPRAASRAKRQRKS